jgi:hypothetical protein
LALNSSKVPARTKSKVLLSIDASSNKVRRSAIQQDAVRLSIQPPPNRWDRGHPRNELLQIDDLRGFDVAAFSSSAADVMKVNRATTPETGAKYASQLTRGISSLRRYAQGH